MFRDAITAACTLTIAGMSLNTYLQQGDNQAALVSIFLALIAAGLSLSAIVRYHCAGAAK